LIAREVAVTGCRIWRRAVLIVLLTFVMRERLRSAKAQRPECRDELNRQVVQLYNVGNTSGQF
jgi:DNA-binding TFAR19-related protein (PDSD5 family)